MPRHISPLTSARPRTGASRGALALCLAAAAGSTALAALGPVRPAPPARPLISAAAAAPARLVPARASRSEARAELSGGRSAVPPPGAAQPAAPTPAPAPAAPAAPAPAAPAAPAPAAPAAPTQPGASTELGRAEAWAASAATQRLRRCESSGNYRATNGSHFGAYQMDMNFWRGYGGGAFAPSPMTASVQAQDLVAYRGYLARGWEPWSCAYAARGR